MQDYLELVDASSRAVRAGKHGSIGSPTPRLLVTLGLAVDEWLPTVTLLHVRYELAIGSPRRMRDTARGTGRRFFRGYRKAMRLYSAT